MRISDWSSDVCSSDLRIIALVVPCEDAPGHALAVGIIGRVNPAADLALGNVERPPVGLGLIGIVGQGMIAIILRLEREIVGHESPSSSSSAATNSAAMRPTSAIFSASAITHMSRLPPLRREGMVRKGPDPMNGTG